MDTDIETWTIEDLQDHAASGDISPPIADWAITQLLESGSRTIGELIAVTTGRLAEWAASQAGGVEIGGRIVKPFQVFDALAEQVDPQWRGGGAR
jgi:hypothetical protein